VAVGEAPAADKGAERLFEEEALAVGDVRSGAIPYSGYLERLRKNCQFKRLVKVSLRGIVKYEIVF
jgi:hypothetical protein